MTAVMAESSSDGVGSNTEEIRVIAHQWWYDVVYQNGVHETDTIHVAAKSDTRLKLESADVIHSFWVPQLNGKLDMIPGKTNVLVIHPARTGEFHGQCGEFCGIGHATMTITVISEDSRAHNAWLADQIVPAAEGERTE
jgi:cytochrome c oxidase subunit 2